MTDLVFVWLLTYLLHSTILISLAFLFERLGMLNRPRTAETVWRIALFGGIATVSAQILLRQFDVAPPTPALPGVFHTFVLPAPVHDITPVLTLLWLIPACIGLLYTAIGVIRLSTGAQFLPACEKPELLAFLDKLCRDVGRAAPTIRVNNRWSSPLVLPNGDICVPDWIFDRLDHAQREAMLAHEVAHVVRGDPAWRISARLISRFGFPQPLHGLVIRRLDLSAELCCDDWAARASGHRRALAEALYTCAQAGQTRPGSALTPAMASPSSPLIVRIVTLLEGGSMFIPKTFRAASIAASMALAITVAALILPAFAIGLDVASSRITMDAQAGIFTARLDGDIVFTKAEDDILQISKPMAISEIISGKTWTIDFTPGSRATSYSIDGVVRPLDVQGRAWLAHLIPKILRETAWDVTDRMKRLQARGGQEAVMAEIETIRSHHARSMYIQAYFKMIHVGPDQVARLLALTQSGTGSDRERAQVYVAAVQTQALDRRQLGALLDDTANMHESAEICHVLLAVAAVMPGSLMSAALFCFLPVVSSYAQDERPKQADMVLSAAARTQTIDTLIREVGQRYVFPDIAGKITTVLRERTNRGDYDGISSARKLAGTLSEQLYELSKDKHMGVRYSERVVPVQSAGGKPTEQEKAQELTQAKAKNFGVERAELLPGNIGYLDLRNFISARMAGDTIGAAMTLLQYTDAIIIDLRKNGGGEPSAVALLASYFFEDRTHINDYFDRATGAIEQSWSSEHLAGPRYGADRPVYILTSARTFSAAEEFAYDMKMLKRATIIGETSGGGAHPGDISRLSEHFQMFIPTGRSINPITKTDWDRVGVAPDVPTSQIQALAVAETTALKRLIVVANDPQRKEQMQRRIDALQQANADTTVRK